MFYILKSIYRNVLLVIFGFTLIIGFLYFVKSDDQSKKDYFTLVLEGPNAIPNDWMAQQRAYPYGKINREVYLEAMEQTSKMNSQYTGMRYEWELAGPINIGGRITDLAIHPDNPSTMYIGGATGGVLKTTDFGATWENVFVDVPIISIGALAIDPNNQNIIYAGTGEANASSYSFYGNGMYKSTDAGATWNHTGLENSAYIGRVVVDYNNSECIFVAACGDLFTPNEERGIYRSLNGGAGWERILYVNDTTAGIDIVQHPQNPDILYASLWERSRGLVYRNSFGDGSGVWKTTDGGNSWVELTNGLPTGNDVGRIGLSIAKSNPDVVYAFYDMPSYEVRVYRTENGGTSWTQTNDGVLDGMNSSFGWYFGQVRVDPENENILYVLGVDLYRSDNGGNNWTQIAGYYNSYEIHVDHHALYIDENTGRIIEGNDGGLYYSDNYGDDWTKINNVPLTQFYAIDIDFLQPQRIYGGTQDNNTIRTWYGGTDDWEAILGGDGMYCLVDHSNSNIIYAESQWGNLAKSTDGGSNFNSINWQMSGDRVNWSAPLAMDPADASTLYFGTYRVWKTTNGGTSWSDVSDDITQGGSNYFHTVTTIAVSPLDRNIVIAGTGDGRVHISTNAGGSWENISDGLPNRWITRVAGDPFESSTIYATVSGFRWDEPEPHVYKSTNLGQDWTDISGNLPELPVNDIIPDPDVEGRLFVGTDAGIYYTENSGNIWASLNQGIPSVPIVAMKLHNPTRSLVIGTYGISAYRLDLDELVNINDKNKLITDMKLHQNYPNPFINETKITYELSKQSFVKISIYNINGQRVRILIDEIIPAGKHTVTWNGTNQSGQLLESGIYFYELKTEKGTARKKMSLISVRL